MGMRETFQIIIDVATENSQKSLKGLRSDVSKAEGGFNKLKVAGSGGMDYLKDHATAFALGAGTALVGFAAKSVAAFESLGLEVEKLTTATGLSAEAASRLIEVAGDIGISSDTLATGIGKMEKTLGANADAFDKYGVAVVHAKDGTIDINATFQNAVERLNAIKDPTEKAAAGAAIFGKGWASMSELIAQGGPELARNLAAVDKAKIFDDKKVQDAKNLREAFDNIKDAGENVALTVGGALAPAMVNASKSVVKFIDDVEQAEKKTHFLTYAIKLLGGNADSAMGNLPDNFEELIPRIEAAGLSVADWNEKLILGKATAADLTEALNNIEQGAVGTSRAFSLTRGAADGLKPSIDNVTTSLKDQRKAEDELRLAELAAIDVKWAYQLALLDGKDAMAAYDLTMKDNKSTADDQERAYIKAQQAIRETAKAYADGKGDIDGSTQSINDQITSLYIQASTLAPGSALMVGLQEQLRLLQAIAAAGAAGIVYYNQYAQGKKANEMPPSPKPGATGGHAAGTKNTGPGPYIAGENGPELIVDHPNATVFNASDTAAMMAGGGWSSGSGSSINLTVHAGLGTDGAAVGQQIVNMLKQYQRTNGPFDFTSR